MEPPAAFIQSKSAITTVLPATTASALTSISTGLAPAQHGILGYRMLVGRDVLNVLRWSVPGGGRTPDPFDVQRHTAFLGRPVPVVTKSEFRNTGFTQAHLRGGRFVGWHTTSALIENCLNEIEAGERLVYAYYPGVDSIAHEFGLRARVWRRELAAADAIVSALLERAIARHRAGDVETPERLYRQILQHEPRHFHALHRLGLVRAEVGDFAAAAHHLGRAVSQWLDLDEPLRRKPRLDYGPAAVAFSNRNGVVLFAHQKILLA